jgi:hypothetical protein
MKTILFTLVLALAAKTAAADISIFDNDQTVTVDCAKDKTVNVVGNNATVTLTGTCDSIQVAGNKATVAGSVVTASITGNENTLALDAVDTVSVTGNKNTVTYKKAIKAKKTKVSTLGNHNKVSQAK